MPRCINLGQLPPITSKTKSVNFRNTTPGSTQVILNPKWARTSEFDGVVDPRHPASKMGDLLRRLPTFHCDHFDLKVFPKAALARPSITWPTPPHKLPPREWPDERRVNVSLNMITSVKPVNNQTVRRAVRNKIRTAVNLLVTRDPVITKSKAGGYVVEWSERTKLDLLLADWTYLIYPKLGVYRLPYATLLYDLRRGFQGLLRSCQQLESHWDVKPKQFERERPIKFAEPRPSTAKNVMSLLQNSLPAEVLEESQEFVEELERPIKDTQDEDWKALLRDISEDLARGERGIADTSDVTDWPPTTIGGERAGRRGEGEIAPFDLEGPWSSSQAMPGEKESRSVKGQRAPRTLQSKLGSGNAPKRTYGSERTSIPREKPAPTRTNHLEKLFKQKPILKPHSSSKNKR